jgi:hypothetical protein
MEDDQFGNTNKQTIKQTEIVLSVLNQMRYYWIRCDDLYTWSAHMIIISHYQICLMMMMIWGDDDIDDVFTLRCTKEPPGMSAFIRPENFQIYFKSGLCSFLALHSRVSNCSNLFFCSSLICLLGKLDWDPDPERLDCSSIAWLLLLLHTDVVTIWRWSWR